MYIHKVQTCSIKVVRSTAFSQSCVADANNVVMRSVVTPCHHKLSLPPLSQSLSYCTNSIWLHKETLQSTAHDACPSTAAHCMSTPALVLSSTTYVCTYSSCLIYSLTPSGWTKWQPGYKSHVRMYVDTQDCPSTSTCVCSTNVCHLMHIRTLWQVLQCSGTSVVYQRIDTCAKQQIWTCAYNGYVKVGKLRT